jgi:hypothetical protein
MKKAKKRLDLLFDDGDAYSHEDLVELWHIFRYAKQFACFGDVCDRISAFSVSPDDVGFVDVECKNSMAKNGSSYWLETIEMPRWFPDTEIY